ncbi:MAG: PAS domain S-box protein [Planctomycetota bacterium]
MPHDDQSSDEGGTEISLRESRVSDDGQVSEEDHVSEEDMVQWLANTDAMDSQECQRLEAHLEQCVSCAERLEDVLQKLQARKAIYSVRDDPLLIGLRNSLENGPVGRSTAGNRQFDTWDDSSIAGLNDAGNPKPSGRTDIDPMVRRHPGQGQPLSTDGGSTTESVPHPRNTPSVADRIDFDSMELIGEGGLGLVYLVVDTLLNRRVVVKLLRPEYLNNVSVRRRFLHEARVTAGMSHPGTVPVHDLIDDGQRLGYVMKLLRGLTLSKRIQQFHQQCDRALAYTEGFLPTKSPATPDPVEDGEWASDSFKEQEMAAADTESSSAAFEDADPDSAMWAGLLELLDAFRSVCNTLAYAHQRGVLHRDIKGENIIVGRFGEVTVIDWGLAKHLEEGIDRNLLDDSAMLEPDSETFTSGFHTVEIEQIVRRVSGAPTTDPNESAPQSVADNPTGDGVTVSFDRSVPPESDRPTRLESGTDGERYFTRPGQRLGTPGFMAPEQAIGARADIGKHTDVYGVCALLYQILTGIPPFQHSKHSDFFRAVQSEKPIRPRDLHSFVPQTLDALCMRGLEKDPARRPASVEEVGREVQNWQNRQASMKQSRVERERFYENSSDLMLVLDATDRIAQTNPAWNELLGFSSAQLRGMSVAKVCGEETFVHFHGHVEQARRGEPQACEILMSSSQGTKHWVAWKLTLVSGDDRIFGIGRDVTAIRQQESKLQDSRDLLRGLLESMPDAIVIATLQGRIVRVNRQVETMFGYQRDELVDRYLDFLAPPSVREAYNGYLRDYVVNASDEPFTARPLLGLHSDGHVFEVRMRVALVELMERSFLLLTVRMPDPDIKQRAKGDSRD